MENGEMLGSEFTKLDHVDFSFKEVKIENILVHKIHSSLSADVFSDCGTPQQTNDESSEDFLCDIYKLLKCELYANEIDISNVLSGISKKYSLASERSTCASSVRGFKMMFQHRCKAGLEYPCDICGKYFAYNSSLNAHKCLLTGVKYTSEMCGKNSTTKLSFVSHQQRHLAIKPFVCDFPNKSIVKKHYLMEHRRVRLGIRPYVCKLCGITFTRSTQMAVHMGAHELQFQCKVCKKGFTRNSQLQEHLRQHTWEKPYRCEVCGKYTRKAHLMKHKCVPISEKVTTDQLVDDQSHKDRSKAPFRRYDFSLSAVASAA